MYSVRFLQQRSGLNRAPEVLGQREQCLREAFRGRKISLQRIGLLGWSGLREQGPEGLGDLSWAGWEGKALPELCRDVSTRWWWGEAVRLVGSPSGVGAALLSGGTMLYGCWHSSRGSSRARSSPLPLPGVALGKCGALYSEWFASITPVGKLRSWELRCPGWDAGQHWGNLPLEERMRGCKLLSKAKGEASDLPRAFMRAGKNVHKMGRKLQVLKLVFKKKRVSGSHFLILCTCCLELPIAVCERVEIRGTECFHPCYITGAG